jgi:hypothetical protein
MKTSKMLVVLQAFPDKEGNAPQLSDEHSAVATGQTQTLDTQGSQTSR